MSRSGFCDDGPDDLESLLAFGRWRAQLNSAIRGKRGRRLLLDMVAALDAMPEKRLIADVMADQAGEACSLTAVARYRGVRVEDLDDTELEGSELGEALGLRLDIAQQLAREVMWINDEKGRGLSPEARWRCVRGWAVQNLTKYHASAIIEEPES